MRSMGGGEMNVTIVNQTSAPIGNVVEQRISDNEHWSFKGHRRIFCTTQKPKQQVEPRNCHQHNCNEEGEIMPTMPTQLIPVTSSPAGYSHEAQGGARRSEVSGGFSRYALEVGSRHANL